MDSEDVVESWKRKDGSIIEIYRKSSISKTYSVRVLFSGGKTAEKHGFGAIFAAMEWGIEEAIVGGKS